MYAIWNTGNSPLNAAVMRQYHQHCSYGVLPVQFQYHRASPDNEIIYLRKQINIILPHTWLSPTTRRWLIWWSGQYKEFLKMIELTPDTAKLSTATHRQREDTNLIRLHRGITQNSNLNLHWHWLWSILLWSGCIIFVFLIFILNRYLLILLS